jgi:hypothetical protein
MADTKLPAVPPLKEQFIDTAEGITLVVDGGHIRGATTLEIQMRKALQDASSALMNARNGLDLGLGCANALTGADAKRRQEMQESYLRRARLAHRAVQEVLGER